MKGGSLMANNKFVHLHLHTQYSPLDGASYADEYAQLAASMGMEALACTDHGVMYGIIDFYKACKKHKIKPIIGLEAYYAPRTRFDKEPVIDEKQYHLVLLAKNKTGLKNLYKLSSASFIEGFYYKARIDDELIEKYASDGNVVITSGCLGGEIIQHILNGNYDKAKERAIYFHEVTGGNFYIEIQDHGLPEQKQTNPLLIRLAKETGIPLVATNDVHYAQKKDWFKQEIMLCNQYKKTLEERKHERWAPEFYLKSPDEMYGLFDSVPEALENTVKIADMVEDYEIEFGKYKLPEFELPEGYTAEEYMRKLTYEGLAKRYDKESLPPEKWQEIVNRVEYELKRITEMGFNEYLLIVWDFIRFAKENAIYVGPGRGSACGSLVCYAIGITDIDSLKYNLLFERFLNPERISMPDIDVDFCFERRSEVVDYVSRKYGKDRVAQILTVQTIAARQAIRDVGRVREIPQYIVDQIAKMIPEDPGITIDKAFEINPKLKEIYNKDSQIKTLIDDAKLIEGSIRGFGKHAAGVVICPDSIENYAPLCLQEGSVTVQFNMSVVEQLGLLKMDFLGLRTLTVMRDTIDFIKQRTGKEITLDSIPLNDPEVLKNIFARGDTDAVFQFESAGMKKLLRDAPPESLEDLILDNAGYRPGPMDQLPRMIEAKRTGVIKVVDESLRHILEVTYGIMIYQEQVMQIVRDLAGYSFGRSDLVRRAMAKKDEKILEKERAIFLYGEKKCPDCSGTGQVDGEDCNTCHGKGVTPCSSVADDGELTVKGAVRNGISEETANKIFDEMMEFAKYAFNKSHAAAYATIAYQTAWLKYYYPTEFMAAVLNSFIDNTKRLPFYINSARNMGIEILPPDINESGNGFLPVGDKKIRFGLQGMKNVGENAVLAILEERKKGKFVDVVDFIERVPSINKTVAEQSIKCGCLDSFGAKRSQLLEVYQDILEGAKVHRKNKQIGQMSLFDLNKDMFETTKLTLPDIPEKPKRELLEYEREILGFYASGHPLDDFEKVIKRIAPNFIGEIEVQDDEMQVKYVGLLKDKMVRFTKKDSAEMATFEIEDKTGTIRAVIFPKAYEKYGDFIKEGEIACVEGSLKIESTDLDNFDAQIIVNKITILKNDRKVYVKVPSFDEKYRRQMLSIANKYPGTNPLVVYFEEQKQVYATKYSVSDCELLEAEIKSAFGKSSYAVV